MRRTQGALVQALIELVLEKRYDAITIQDLLDRADVGRSTFYSHYRSKDDLLLRSFERMIDMLDRSMDRDGTPTTRVAPVRELFHHVGQFRSFHQALARARVLERQHQSRVDHLSRTIERRLAALSSQASIQVPRSVLAQAFAGAVFALLAWWIDHEEPYSPERMDEMVHAMILGAPGRR